VIDVAVVEVGYIECIVSPECVRADDAVRFHLLLNDGKKRFRLGVRDDRRVDLPTSLQQAKYNHFAHRPASALSFSNAAEITLVRLDLAAQSIARQLARNQLAQMHEKADRGVRLNADDLTRGAGCAASHKMLDQLALLARRKPALALVHRSHRRTSKGS
jgi:hypothetical protein